MTEPAAFVLPGIQRVTGATGDNAVVGSDGSVIYPDNYAKTLTYNTDGTLATVAFTDSAGVTWTKTYTYTSGNLTGISKYTRP